MSLIVQTDCYDHAINGRYMFVNQCIYDGILLVEQQVDTI